jgi:hypothetical protein
LVLASRENNFWEKFANPENGFASARDGRGTQNLKQEGPQTCGPSEVRDVFASYCFNVTAFNASTIPLPKKLLSPVSPWQVAVGN